MSTENNPAAYEGVEPMLTNVEIREIMHKSSRYMGQPGYYSDTEFDCLQDVISFARAIEAEAVKRANTENNVAAQAGDEPMRAAFEVRFQLTSVTREGYENGRYRNLMVQFAWEGWQAALDSPRATADVERDACTWTHEEDNYAWASACGELWSFIDGGPEENRVKFCQGCGKSVAIATTKPGA